MSGQSARKASPASGESGTAPASVRAHNDRCASLLGQGCDCQSPWPEQSRLYTVPVTLKVTQAFVAEHHRHHEPTTGHKVSTGVVDEAGELRGVAVMEYPKARMIDRQQVAEVTRVATDGCPNACSALYGAMCRLQRAHGFALCITYTLLDEPGTSLRGAGWRPVAVTKGGSWKRISRVRTDRHPTGPKIRWECLCSTAPAIDLEAVRNAA